jgi:ABC-type multidrug transport system fused ATPase/permease subunit
VAFRPKWRAMLPPRSFLLQKASEGGASGGGSRHGKATQSNLKWMLSLCREDKARLSVGVVGMTMASGMNLVLPRIMGKALDVATGKPPPAGLSKKGFFFVVLTTFVTGSIGSYLRTYSLGMVSERIAARLRKRLYSVLLAQEFNFFHHRKVGELVSRLSTDCQVTANAVVEILGNGYRSLNSAVGASVMLLTISPKLTLVSLSILPLVGTGAMVFSKFSSRLAQVHQNSIASMTGVVEERLNNIFTVKLFAAEHYEEQEFDKVNAVILKNAARAKRARGVFMGGLSLAMNCSLFSVLYMGGSFIGSNELTIGSLTSFALYSGFMGLGFSSLSSCFSEMRRTRESSAVLFDLLATQPSEHEASGQQTIDEIVGHIKFENVSFAYPARDDIMVLDELDMEIHPGEVVAIVGKSGAGKTTIASLMSKILAPSKGKVLLDGVDIRTLDTKWLRKQIGVVNQVSFYNLCRVMINLR